MTLIHSVYGSSGLQTIWSLALTSLLFSHLPTADGVLRAANPLLGVLLLANELLLGRRRRRLLLLQRVRLLRRLIWVHFKGVYRFLFRNTILVWVM